MTTATKQLTVHIVLEQLKAEGVRYVFGASTSSESPIAASLHASKKNEDLSLLTNINELSAVFAAMGYSQATSLPAVVNLAAGAGLLSAAPAIYAASRTQVPLIILTDQEDSHILNDDPPLSFDHQANIASVCKWTAEARTAREICRLMRRAFHEALTPPKGPVVLSIPINLLLSSAKSEILRPPLTSSLGPADENFVAKVVTHILKAKNPCIVAGNEVALYRARKDVVLISEVTGCPVYAEPIPTGVAFPNRHPNFAGVLPLSVKESNALLREHDLVIVLGVQTRLPNRTEGPSLVPDDGIVVQVNIDGHLAGKSLNSSLATQADISETLSRIRAEIQLAADNNFLNTARERSRSTAIKNNERRQRLESELSLPDPDKPANLAWLLKILDGVRPERTVLVSDIFSEHAMPAEILSLESGSSYFSSNSGVNGYAAGAALGLQWSSKNIPAICLTGDESFLANPQVLWMAAHHGLNVKFIIANTRGAKRLNLLPSAPTRRLPRWQVINPSISLVKMAESMGVPGTKVSRFSDLEPALAKLFAESGPGLVDIDTWTD